jgi:hypothetical protein
MGSGRSIKFDDGSDVGGLGVEVDVEVAHIRTVASFEPDTMRLPSEESAKAVAGLE